MDPDDITYLRIAQLHPQGVDLSFSQWKDKTRIASYRRENVFQLQAALVNSFLGVIENKRIAVSGTAIDTDLGLDRGGVEEDIHRYAAGLSRWEPFL
ncbi:hypothetical protein AAF712_008882 [Marasmius tenuissimus]|uniref:Uncharacterized protein n=1 Tax=Marasmius tenuissimus TaxID=585030 RepID=A0ABR2ZSA7_9AGAR